MTTIIPTPATLIPLTVTLASPFHHGAGSSGNTSLLRTQDVVQPDGTVARVPFLSGGSIRHALRDALAWHTVKTLGVKEGSLTKRAVDLLWVGGSVSTTGARTDLDMMRRVDELLPHVALCGYSAKSDIITGTLRASDMILVCRENDQRLPDELKGAHRAAAYRSEEFGTRHDQATSPAGRYIQLASEMGTSQMIWDTQVLAAGSRLYGEITLTPAATATHRTALLAALALWAPGGVAYLGAKTAQGYGKATIYGIPTSANNALITYTDRLEEHRKDILDLIEELGK